MGKKLRYPDVAHAHKSGCAHTAISHAGRFCNLFFLEFEIGQDFSQNMPTPRVALILDIRGYDVQNEFVLQYHPGRGADVDGPNFRGKKFSKFRYSPSLSRRSFVFPPCSPPPLCLLLFSVDWALVFTQRGL